MDFVQLSLGSNRLRKVDPSPSLRLELSLVTANCGNPISLFQRKKIPNSWPHDCILTDENQGRSWIGEPLKKVFLPDKRREKSKERNYFQFLLLIVSCEIVTLERGREAIVCFTQRGGAPVECIIPGGYTGCAS